MSVFLSPIFLFGINLQMWSNNLLDSFHNFSRRSHIQKNEGCNHMTCSKVLFNGIFVVVAFRSKESQFLTLPLAHRNCLRC